jgi:hypothetical protein
VALAGIAGRPAGASGGPRGPVLERGQALIVADGDGDFRQMVAAVVGAHFEIHEAANGVEALELVTQAVARAVLVGRNLPILNGDALAAKLRALPGPSRRLVAVSPKAEVSAAEQSGLYDAVVTRTFIAEAFGAAIEALLRPADVPPLERLLARVPWFKTSVTTAVQQVFAAVLKLDVEPLPDASSGGAASIERTVVLLVDDELAVTLTAACDQATARAMSEIMSDGQSADSLGEIAAAVGGHLEQSLVSRGVAAVQRAASDDPASEPLAIPSDDTTSLWFGVADRDLRLNVRLAVAALADSPAEEPLETKAS